MVLKRGTDAATAVRFRDAFREAGAIVQLVEVSAGGEEKPEGLALAPVDGRPLEETPSPPERRIDISHLSLTPGEDWTLEDCEPPLPPLPLPDISHLEIIEPEPVEKRPDWLDD